MNPIGWTALGALLTFSIFLATVIFHTGKLSARVDALEKWRWTMRDDMREISDIITNMTTELKRLATLIEERTERRENPRLKVGD
jgi:hypothetical protein